MLMLNKTAAAVMSSVMALLPEGANRALVRFRMTSSNRENGFVGLAVVADSARSSFTDRELARLDSAHLVVRATLATFWCSSRVVSRSECPFFRKGA
jgi:hypothetical protein